MPRSAVERLVARFRSEPRDPFRRAAMVCAVTETFDVSSEAATYRLKDLGFIPKDDMMDYSVLAVFLDAMI